MSSLQAMSKKRAAAVKDGSVKLRGTFAVNLADIRDRKSPIGKKVQDALFGKLQTNKDARKKAKAAAWKWFSEWIRLRDAGPDGRAECITCQRSDHWRTMDAGHYLTRAKESTLFDERNVSCQCKGCNRFQGGKFYEHGQAVDRKFGPGTRHDLERKAGQVCKRTVNDYLFIADTYKKRVQWIKEHEPQRYFRKL
jgi:hypothetical protein